MTIDPLKMHPPMLRPGPRGPGAFERSFFIFSLLLALTAVVSHHDLSNALADVWTERDSIYYPIMLFGATSGLVGLTLRTHDCPRRVRRQLALTGGALVILGAQWAIYAISAFHAGWGGYQGGFIGTAMTVASVWRLVQIVRDLGAMDAVVSDGAQ